VRNRLWTGLAAVLALASCKPKNVAEAEARGDVSWLRQDDAPEATTALGRLADRDPAAAAALAVRSTYDAETFRAAWAAVMRGAPWGTSMLRDALGDPARADSAASMMGRRDAHMAAFAADLEKALVRLSASPRNTNVAAALASAPGTREAVERRLNDASTRGSMCTGIAAGDSDDGARQALLAVPEASRDAPACVTAVVVVAAVDETALAWLAETGEPGLLGAAGKSNSMPCARLHGAWVKAFAARPATAYSALTVPLGYAVKRCPAQMDGILADALAHAPSSHAIVVEAIDPFASYGDALHATCAALPAVTSGHDSAVVRERAADTLAHACITPG
jgi:hypothetical protein